VSHLNDIAAKHADADNAQLAADVAEVMKSPAGRRLFMRIIVKGGIYRQSSAADDQIYLAGRRDFALEALALANRHAIDDALKAQIESNEQAKHRARELQSAQSLDQIEKRSK
jgi:hypothetical protein